MWELVSGVLAFVVLVGGAVIVLIARRQDIARVTAERNVSALTSLVGTRDIQLSDKTRDLETLEAEHRQLIQVNVKEVVTGWLRFQTSLTAVENARLRSIIEECIDCPLRARETKA